MRQRFKNLFAEEYLENTEANTERRFYVDLRTSENKWQYISLFRSWIRFLKGLVKLRPIKMTAKPLKKKKH